MVVCQEQSSQPAKVTNVLHAFDEIFAEVERIELLYSTENYACQTTGRLHRLYGGSPVLGWSHWRRFKVHTELFCMVGVRGHKLYCEREENIFS